MKLSLARVAILLAICTPFAIAKGDELTQADLQGFFGFSIDVPGAYLKGEIHFLPGNSCTLRFANFDSFGPLYSGTCIMGPNGILEIDAAYDCSEQTGSQKDKGSTALSINLLTAKKDRVLKAIETADPDEKKNGTDIQTGSRVEFKTSAGAIKPFRFFKMPGGNSFFEGIEQYEKIPGCGGSRPD